METLDELLAKLESMFGKVKPEAIGFDDDTNFGIMMFFEVVSLNMDRIDELLMQLSPGQKNDISLQIAKCRELYEIAKTSGWSRLLISSSIPLFLSYLSLEALLGINKDWYSKGNGAKPIGYLSRSGEGVWNLN